MARFTKQSATLMAVGMVAVVAVLASESRSVANQTAKQGPSRELRLRQEAAWLSGGMRSAASVSGTYMRTETAAVIGAPASLSELSALSHAIVVAKVQSNHCQLSDDGRSVNTLFRFRLEQLLKKSPTLNLGAEFEVRLPGGRADFGNGTWAQLNVAGFVMPMEGQRLLLFVRRIGGEADLAVNVGFEPTSGPLSVFALDQMRTGFVVPNGALRSVLARDLIAKRYGVPDFIDAVRNAIAQ
jgi:hypothetical protein